MQNKAFSTIWIIIILVILIGGGFLVWQYWWLPKEEAKTPEEKPPTLIEYSKERLPRFEDFPVSEKFEDQPALANFSTNQDMLRFVTRITEGAQKGPNFAGHYTVISWGCGTECQSGVIVDAKTGAIYSSFVTELGSEFRIDSNLFIVNSLKTIEEVYGDFEIPEWVYTAYYKWESNQFINIYDTRIADWKTYRNEEYGFEVKYPQQLFTKERFSVTQSEERDYILLKEIMIDDEEGNYHDNQIFNIRVYNNLSNLQLSEWLNNNQNSDERGCGVLSLDTATSVIVNGKGGLRGDVSCCCGAFLNSVFLSKGDKIYSIGLLGAFISDEYYKGIFDKVLSTFKFLE